MIDSDIINTAARQGGFVRRDQLLKGGVSSSAIGRHVASGRLTPVAAGVYQVIEANGHLDLLRGATLTLPSAVVSFQSAAHLLRFPRLPELVPTVSVHSRTTHNFPGVAVRRCGDLLGHHFIRLEGLRVTSVARTVFDLAGILGFEEIDAIVEALVVASRLRIEQLAQLVDEVGRRGKRGTQYVRQLLALRGQGSVVDPTILERRGLAALIEGGLSVPMVEFPIPWETGRRFDAAYPDARLAIEWDSRKWHTQQSAFDSDRERDRKAMLNGWLVVRFTWADVVDGPDEVCRTIAALLTDRSARTVVSSLAGAAPESAS